MAKEKFYSKYTNQQIENLLDNSSDSPFCLYYDTAGTKAMYRLFSVGPNEKETDRRDAWLEAREKETMTDEISKYLIGSFEAPAPYSITLSFTSKEQVHMREGDKVPTIDYTFFTADSSGNKLSESIQVIYTFNNGGAIQSTTKIYNSGEEVKMNIEKYLTVGNNTISMSVTGRTTGATAIYILHYNVVSMDLTSTFNVAVPQRGNRMTVPFALNCSSSGVKTIEFYIDSELAHQVNASETKIDSAVELNLPSKAGKHHLQIRAYVETSEGKFYSKTLYREFVIVGEKGTFIMVNVDLESGTLITPDKKNLVLYAEQYVQTNITWGYFNSSGASSTVRWSLGGEAIRATEAQVTDAESNAKPYILSFVPTVSGTLSLSASINNSETAAYSLVVEVNSSGISEATSGLQLKLTTTGRDNREPDNEKCIWEDKDAGIQAQFPEGWAWSERQGWVTDEETQITALSISGGKQVTIPFAPLSNAPHTNGCTIELDFETSDVDDEDATVISIWGRNMNGIECGIKVTAEGVIMRSGNGAEMKTRFKQGERIKLAFVVNRVSSQLFPHLAFIYANGVYERAVDYTEGGSYTNNAQIVLGDATGKASLKVYGIRCYNQAITVQQEMYNYFIDSGIVAQKIIDNDIYANGVVSVEKMQGVIPVMLVDGLDTAYNNITTLEGVKDKNTKINVNVSFYNPFDPTKNFTIEGARMKLQGTSSLGYPRKNFKLYSKKDNAIMKDFEGNVITKGLYAFKDGDVPVNTWTLKADFMDSSCTRNASVARIFGDIEPKLNIKDASGRDALKTPPQLAAQRYESESGGTKFPYNLRTTPNGLAIVMFHRLPGDTQYTFLGQYTMLNDKGNEYVYGFHSIYVPTAGGLSDPNALAVLQDPMAMYMKDSVKDGLVNAGKIRRIFDNKDVHCYEILDNISEYSNFNTVDNWSDPIIVEGTNLKHCKWESGFESRYPEIDDDDYLTDSERLAEGEKQGAPLKAFINWMLSCYKTSGGTKVFDITKFENEMEDHLNLHFCAAYYVYLLRWGAVDQVKKNMMWTTYGERSGISAGTSTYDNLIWFPIRYDNDSTVDTRNDGTFFYNYKFTRSDLDPTLSGAYYYSGHDSLLWNALEQSEKFMQLVVLVDNEFYAAGLTYEQVIHYYDDLARDQWCESIYNENQHYKYIAPLLRTEASERADYLGFLHGSDKSHQHWWFRNRFDMIDSNWGTGEFSNKFIHFLAPNCPVTAQIKVVGAKNTRFGVSRNKVAVLQDNDEFTKPCNKDEQITLGVRIPADTDSSALQVGDPIYINGGNNISELDLSEFSPYLSTYLELDKIYDKELGSNMKKLIVGIPQELLNSGVTNTSEWTTVSGIGSMTRLEYLDLKGITGLKSFDFLNTLTSLKTLLLDKTGMKIFRCADGVSFNRLQLPNTLESMNLSRVNWTTLEYTPTTALRSLNLNYMNDETTFGEVKNFVFAWLDMLEREFPNQSWSDFSLNLTGINWTDVPYHRIEQLMNLGSVVLSGHSYIKCNRTYTNAEMTAMISKFGPNIFTDGQDLVFDCDGNVVVLGAQGLNGAEIYTDEEGRVVMHETDSIQLIATGFPIRGGTSGLVLFNILDSASAGGVSVNSEGVVESKEFGNTAHTVIIRATRGSSKGDISIRVLPLTYPTSITIGNVKMYGTVPFDIINGAVYISNTGRYTFEALFDPADFTGNIESSRWIYSSTNEALSALCKNPSHVDDPVRKTCIEVNSITGDIEETLVYNAVFKNIAKDPNRNGINSDTLRIIMNAIVNVVYGTNFGDESIQTNPALYSLLIEYIDELDRDGVINSLELRLLAGELNLSQEYGLTTFISNNLNALDYMSGVTSLNCRDCENLTSEVDTRKMTSLQMLNLGNTPASLKSNNQYLTNLLLGSPTEVTLENTDSLEKDDFTIQDLSNLNSLKFTPLVDDKSYTWLYEQFKDYDFPPSKINILGTKDFYTDGVAHTFTAVDDFDNPIECDWTFVYNGVTTYKQGSTVEFEAIPDIDEEIKIKDLAITAAHHYYNEFSDTVTGRGGSWIVDINKVFDGTSCVDTNLTLLDDEHTNWIIFIKPGNATSYVASNRTQTQTALHLMWEASPYPGIDLHNKSVGTTYTEGLTLTAIQDASTRFDEQKIGPLAIKRNGSSYSYTQNGVDWTALSNVPINAGATLVIGGYKTTSGTYGRYWDSPVPIECKVTFNNDLDIHTLF